MEEIIVFGIGKYYETKKSSISENYKVVLGIDNSVLPSESKDVDGLQVINPADLKEGNNRIFLMSVHFITMWKQLVELGIDPNRIVLPFDIKPFFENDEAISGELKNIIFEKEIIINYRP